MAPKIHHLINWCLAIAVCIAFINVLLSLVDSGAGVIAHLVNVWVFTSLYELISFNGD